MADCKEVEHWFTKNVFVPVTRFIYEATERCEDVKQWVQEEVWDRVEEFISRQERWCEDLPWPLDWICKVVVIIEKIVTYVPRTIWRLIINVVCKIILKVIGSFIEIVLKVIRWCLTFFVCILVDPLEALKSLLDLWDTAVDALRKLFELISAAIHIAIDFVDDFNRLVDSVAETLGPLGVLLSPWKAIGKLADGLLNAGSDLVDGAKDAVTGALKMNPCAMARGVSKVGSAVAGAAINTGFIVFAPVKIAGTIYAGGRDIIDRWHRNRIITDAVNAAFGADPARVARVLADLNLGAENGGKKFRIAPYRIYLSSEATDLDLRALHQAGVINLFALAGFPGACRDALNEPEGEVVYADSPFPVSLSDLTRYVERGRGSTPEFWVFPIKVDHFKWHIDLAARKSTVLGVQYSRLAMGRYRARLPTQLPLRANDDAYDANNVLITQKEQQDIFGELGRNGVSDDLSVIPVVSHFHYVRAKPEAKSPLSDLSELFGLASSFSPPVASTSGGRTVTRSGVSYRNRSPDWVFRWVLTHELGHYLGISHEPWPFSSPPAYLRSLDEVMYAPSSGEMNPGAILYEFLVAGGEPRFTVGDIRYVWFWMTTSGSSLLP